MQYVKSKKSELYPAIVLAGFAIATAIGFSLVYSLYISNLFSQQIEEHAPEMNYEYPRVVVSTFLYQKVDLNDSKKIFGDDKEYRVRDLLWEASPQSLDLAQSYASKFLFDVYEMSDEEAFSLFLKFSGANIRDEISIANVGNSYVYNDGKLLGFFSVPIRTKEGQFVEVSYG